MWRIPATYGLPPFRLRSPARQKQRRALDAPNRVNGRVKPGQDAEPARAPLRCAKPTTDAISATDEIALRAASAVEQLHRIFARRLADEHIVAADELGNALRFDVAVEQDRNRSSGVLALASGSPKPSDCPPPQSPPYRGLTEGT
jgi:hypothetical protein